MKNLYIFEYVNELTFSFFVPLYKSGAATSSNYKTREDLRKQIKLGSPYDFVRHPSSPSLPVQGRMGSLQFIGY